MRPKGATPIKHKLLASLKDDLEEIEKLPEGSLEGVGSLKQLQERLTQLPGDDTSALLQRVSSVMAGWQVQMNTTGLTSILLGGFSGPDAVRLCHQVLA